MQGLHLTADLHDCRCAPELMIEALRLAAVCRRHTEQAGLCIVNEIWHGFPGQLEQAGGVTGVLLLAESHLAIHTWPEQKAVTLDVYVCNYGADNSARARGLMAALMGEFKATQVQQNALNRGEGRPLG